MKKLHFGKILIIGILPLFIGASFGASVEPLSCDAHGPYEGNVMEDIEFDGTATGGTPPYEFLWDYGDGNSSSGDPHPTHNYANSGNYTVILTVTDSENDTASDTTWAFINAPPSAPVVTVPDKVRRGKLFKVEVVSTDPDGDDVYYRDELNDCTSQWYGPFPSGQKYSYMMSISGAPGTYTLGVQSKDTFDAESEWTYSQINVTKNKELNNPLLRFLQFHPNMFPIIRYLLGLH